MSVIVSHLDSQWTAIGLLITITAVSIWYFKHKHRNHLPPGPWGFPVIGYLPFLGPQPQTTFLQLSKKYGDIFSIHMGSFLAVVLNGREAIKEALITNGGIFDTRPGFFTFSRLKDRLAFGLYSDCRTVHKKIVVNRLNSFINSKEYPLGKLLQDESAAFVADIMKHSDKPFDPKMDLYVTACSVIFQIAYGRGNNVRQNDDFIRLISNQNTLIEFVSSGNPAEVMPWLSRVFPAIVKPINNFLKYQSYIKDKQIMKHRETFSKDNIRDLADSFIDLTDGTTEMKTVGLGFERLSTALEEVIPAAFDTTATAMRWVLLCLVKFPHVQGKLAEEIISTIGDRVPSIEDRQNMPYTEAVILETLRFKAPLPLALPHAATKNTKLNGYDIPKDTTVLVNLHSLARDFSVWDFPNSFYPEHFLTSSGELDRDKVMFISPFGIGKRKCIGEKLARDSLFMSLVSMLQRFKIMPVDGEAYDMVGISSLTDWPKPFKIFAISR